MERATSKEPAASACSVCGASLRREVSRPASTYSPPGTYRIDACDACGCGQTLPRPDEAELSAFYARDYKYDAHVLIKSEKRWRARRILEIAGVTAGRASRVLDVGCMYGYLLEEARALGASEAVGVELSSAPAADARARGLDVFCGTIEEFAKTRSGQTFDLVVAQHVLEHVGDLASFLTTAHKLVAPGGRLCICVPNFNARARRLFPEAWGWYQVPVHLHHFGLPSIEKLLDAHGFEVDRHEERGGDSLFVLLTLLQSIGRAPSSEAVEPGVVGKGIVRLASAVLRPYYFLGDDELVVVARSKASSTRTS